MLIKENILLAIESIRGNWLRSILTLLIIAVGIACLVGILTAIDSVLNSMNSNFSKLGANSYSITQLNSSNQRRRGKKVKRGPVITFDQALEFKETFSYGGSKTAVSSACGMHTIRHKKEKTGPTINVTGIDGTYLNLTGSELVEGRNFSTKEITAGAPAAILGHEVAKTLFEKVDSEVIGKIISIDSDKYRVSGVLESKGSSSGQSRDKVVLIPLMQAKIKYGYANQNYNIQVSTQDPKLMEEAISSGIGRFRNVRRLRADEANDFEIVKSDGVMEQLKSMTSKLRVATIIIATLTLLGAAIGLMNIMLVSVTERTKEIGVRKAIGATRQNILLQFLVEAVVICLMGGIVGIILGILLGVGVTVAVKGTFMIPWNWMLLGIVVCIVVGVISGLYPAIRASRLDPIESLRYE